MANRNFTNFNEFLNIRYIRKVDSIYMDPSDFDYMVEGFKKISEENTKLKAEIEQLKEDYSVLARQYNNVENSSIRYYNEVKQLKSEIEQWQSTNLKLVCELTRIECENNQLKAELEQSDLCDGCKHNFDRNEYYCDSCKRISVDNFELKSEVGK